MFPRPPTNNQNSQYLNQIYGGNTQTQTQTSNPFAPSVPNYGFNPYQIQTGDTFESIAQKNNIDLTQIQSANSGMLVPPPKGSYINLPNPELRQAQTYTPQYDPRRGRGWSEQYQSANPQTSSPGPGRGSYEASRNLAAQIANGIAPSSVPSSMLAMLDATPASMQAAGYVFNQATGSWNLPAGGAQTTGIGAGAGGATPQSDNNWMTNPALRQITFNRNAKNPKSRFTTNLKWAQNAWRRKAGKGKNQKPQQAVQGGDGSRATPGTVLELHLGSG